MPATMDTSLQAEFARLGVRIDMPVDDGAEADTTEILPPNAPACRV